MSKLCDGLDDQITDEDITSLAVTGALTTLSLLKIATTNDTAWLSFIEAEAAGSLRIAMGRRNDGNIYYANGAAINSAVAIQDADGWMLDAVTKATGTSTPSAHKLPIGGSRTTAAFGGTMASGAATNVDVVRLAGNDDFANIYYGAAAIFDKVLTTTELDGILSAKTSQSIMDLTPIWFADDGDDFGLELVSGRTLTKTGTTDSADDPAGWVYLGGAAVSTLPTLVMAPPIAA